MGDSNFSMREIRFVFISFGALIIINGMLFGTGIFADELTKEPPRLNATGSDIVTAGAFPDSPGVPDAGTLEYKGENAVLGESYQYAQDSGQDLLTVEVQNVSSGFQVLVANYEPDTNSDGFNVSSIDTYAITKEGQYIRHSNESGGETWVIDFNVTQLDNYLQSNMTSTVEWEVIRQTSDSGGFFSGVFSAGDDVAQVLGYLGLIIRWIVAVIVETIIGVVVTVGELLAFLVGLVDYLVTGWIQITNAVSQTSPYLTLILWAPQIPLYLILFNAIMKILKVLPTT